MPNSYFQFKQFIIHQDKTGMKVTTDACLFGSLFDELIDDKEHPHKVLDIGTGTGLLSLMYAQQFPKAMIDAVEIDDGACEQARQNCHESIWKERINVILGDILEFDPPHLYDVIICNPPFFENDLKSPNQQRNKALHDHTLTLEKLVEKTTTLLTDNGILLVLLPFHRTVYFLAVAEQNNLYCNTEILVKQTENHDYFRTIMKFSKNNKEINKSELMIVKNKEYSQEFKRLLSPFYLAL